MTLLNDILEVVGKVYTPAVCERFIRQFESTPYANMLNSPMLNNGETVSISPRGLDDLPFDKLRSFTVGPVHDNELTLTAMVDITTGVSDLSSLFDRFVRCTAHVNFLCDFRHNTAYCASLFKGQRYLVGHGDGHCVALGLMFQQLCRITLDRTVTLNYCRAPEHRFAHVYATSGKSKDVRGYYIDPDQKVLSELDGLDSLLPTGFLFQLIGFAGFRLLHDLVAADQDWLIPSRTRMHMAAYDDSGMYVFSETPNPVGLAWQFSEARNHHLEPLSIEADDYPWKSEFRKECESQGLAQYMFSDLSTPWVLRLPPGSSARIGAPGEDLPEEVRQLFLIFFGRAPCTLRVGLPAGKPVPLRLPDVPWALIAPSDGSMILVNGASAGWHEAADGTCRIVGMTHFEHLFDAVFDSLDITLQAETATYCTIVLPVNAFALNSGFARMAVSGKSSDAAPISAQMAA